MNELWEAQESLLGQGPGTVACPAIKTPWCFSHSVFCLSARGRTRGRKCDVHELQNRFDACLTVSVPLAEFSL